MTELFKDPEWARLEELGFISEYVRVGGHTLYPAITADDALAIGLFPKGTKVRWVDHNGYDHERRRARHMLGTERIFTIHNCSIGRSSSKYILEEEKTYAWNSVMFEKVEQP